MTLERGIRSINAFEIDLVVISKILKLGHMVHPPQEKEERESPDGYEAKIGALASGLDELPSLDYAQENSNLPKGAQQTLAQGAIFVITGLNSFLEISRKEVGFAVDDVN